MNNIRLNELDLLSINIIVQLYEHKSATRVSHKLNLPAPKISRSLKRARDIFENELFIRKKHGLVPNEFSHKLYPIAKNIMKCADELKSLETPITNHERPHFEIAAPDLIAYKLPTELMSCIRSAEKPFSFNINAWTSTSLSEIASEHIHLGLICCQTNNPSEHPLSKVPSQLREQLEAILIKPLRQLYLISDSNHPVTLEPPSLESIARYPFINTVFGKAGQTHETHSPYQEYCERKNIQLTTEIAITSLSSLFDYLKYSQAVALVPYSAVHEIVINTPYLSSSKLPEQETQKLYTELTPPSLYLVRKKSHTSEEVIWLSQQIQRLLTTIMQ